MTIEPQEEGGQVVDSPRSHLHPWATVPFEEVLRTVVPLEVGVLRTAVVLRTVVVVGREKADSSD